MNKMDNKYARLIFQTVNLKYDSVAGQSRNCFDCKKEKSGRTLSEKGGMTYVDA